MNFYHTSIHIIQFNILMSSNSANVIKNLLQIICIGRLSYENRCFQIYKSNILSIYCVYVYHNDVFSLYFVMGWWPKSINLLYCTEIYNCLACLDFLCHESHSYYSVHTSRSVFVSHNETISNWQNRRKKNLPWFIIPPYPVYT